MEATEAIIRELTRLYDEAVFALRADIAAYVCNGTHPAPERRALWCYPELRIDYQGQEFRSDVTRAFGKLSRDGRYACTVTRPALFADYLREQLHLLRTDYAVQVDITDRPSQIPFPYVLDGIADLHGIGAQELSRHFPATELAHIGDELADGMDLGLPGEPFPFSLFDGLRTDFSLARLAHYTGTAPEHFQRFVLFTNYHRYVDEFVDWAGRKLGEEGYTALAGAGDF